MFQVCSLDLNKNTKEKYSKNLPTAKTTLAYVCIVGSRGASQLGGYLLGNPPGYKAIIFS